MKTQLALLICFNLVMALLHATDNITPDGWFIALCSAILWIVLGRDDSAEPLYGANGAVLRKGSNSSYNGPRPIPPPPPPPMRKKKWTN